MNAIQPPGAIAAQAEQTDLGQHLEMLRDRLAGRSKMVRDLAGRQLLIVHEPQDRDAARLGQRLEQILKALWSLGTRRRDQLDGCPPAPPPGEQLATVPT